MKKNVKRMVKPDLRILWPKNRAKKVPAGFTGMGYVRECDDPVNGEIKRLRDGAITYPVLILQSCNGYWHMTFPLDTPLGPSRFSVRSECGCQDSVKINIVMFHGIGITSPKDGSHAPQNFTGTGTVDLGDGAVNGYVKLKSNGIITRPTTIQQSGINWSMTFPDSTPVGESWFHVYSAIGNTYEITVYIDPIF